MVEGGKLRLVFLLLAFAALAVSLALFGLSLGKPFMGGVLALDRGGWTVKSVDPASVAEEAGIRPGDTPVEINGQPARDFLEKYEKHGLVYGRLIKDVTVVDDRGQLKSATIAGAALSTEAVTGVAAWFAVCLAFWVAGFYVFFRRPKNAAALLLCLCGLSLGLAFSGNVAGERAVPFAAWLEITGTVMFPWLLAHFFLVLPAERSGLCGRRSLYLLYIPPVVTLVLFPIVGYADGQAVEWFRNIRLVEYGAGFLGAVGVAVFNYFGAASLRTKQQMKIVMVSVLAALLPFVVLNIAPEAIWGRIYAPTELALLPFAFVPMGLGYAVVFRKLMDIDVIIRRGVVYALISVAMAIVLSAALVPLLVAQGVLSWREEILMALVWGGAATALFGPTKKGAEFLVDKLLYKDRYDYRKIINSLSISLNLVKEPVEISRVVVGTTVGALNLAGSCLLVRGQSGTLEVSVAQGTFVDPETQGRLSASVAHRTPDAEFPNPASTLCPELAFLVPLIAGEKEVGVLCLSPKTTRQDFSPDDIYLLQGIASVAGMAVRSAMLVRDVSIRDTFVSVASHELRTPLTSIVGYADLLLSQDPPAATRKQWIKQILDSSRRISDMVDDLLNVSRIQSGKTHIRLEQTGLSEVLEETMFFAEQGTDKHEFVLSIDPLLPHAMVDRDKFGQVVSNLLSNAVKYSPNGGRITVSARHDKERRRIVVSVTDEGMGIGPEHRDLLFTTFYRIQRPETSRVRGNGLGLHIAKGWMEAMGGKVWFESELNKGSTFFVAVPARDSGEPGDGASPLRGEP